MTKPVTVPEEAEDDGNDFKVSDVKGAFGRVSKVAVGKPRFRVLPAGVAFNDNVALLPQEFKADCDYHWVALSCTFQPDCDSEFKWGKLEVRLNCYDRDTGKKIRAKPTVHAIYPAEKTVTIKETRSTELKGSVKPGEIGEGSVTASTTKSLDVVMPEVYGYGSGTSTAGWVFKSTPGKGLYGDKTDLSIIVEAPKGSDIRGRIKIGVKIWDSILNTVWVPKRIDDCIDREFQFS